MWASRFQHYSVAQQQINDRHDADANLAFTIPREYIPRDDLTSASLFHGGIDSPTLIAFDPILKRSVHITKYLYLKSKTSTPQYIDHLYERIILTKDLSHPNVHQVLSWYIANACVYAVTNVIQRTLRHAIQSETFSLERISRLSLEIIHGTLYLQSRGLCPLTPWYTTNIELTDDDHIRLCSPTISTTKLNGGLVRHHHLWRHAPESLIRMILIERNYLNEKTIDNSKEDVWSIGCIIIEMMINTMIFRPQNDDPSLQLLCIVRYVGGLTLSVFERLPLNVQQLFSNMRLDSHQKRLHHLLKKILNQDRFLVYQHNFCTRENLFNLLKEMFQFQCEKRISLESLIEHPFYVMNSSLKNNKIRMNSLQLPLLSIKTSSIQINDLVNLGIKLNLKQPRWVLTLKERCLFELILHIKDFNLFDLYAYGLSQSVKFEIKKLIYFLTDT